MHPAASALLGPQSLPPFVGAVVGLGVGVLLIASAQGELRPLFGAMALLSALWSLGVGVLLGLPQGELETARAAGQVVNASVSLLCAGGLQCAFALARTGSGLGRLLVGFALVAAAAILFVPGWTEPLPRAGGGFWVARGGSGLLAAATTIPSVALAAYHLSRVFRALPPCRRRSQIGWALGACAVGLLGLVDLSAAGYPVAWALGQLTVLTLFYAVGGGRLVAVRTFAARAALGLVGAALGVGTVYLAVGVLPGRRPLGPAALGIWAVLLFLFMRGWVSAIEPWLSRRLHRRLRRMERAIADFERRALDAHSTEEVAEDLALALREGFGAELRAFLPADRERAGEPLEVRRAEATLLGGAGRPAAVLRAALDLDAPEGPPLLAGLDRLKADAIVPLSREEEVVGFVACAGPALRAADDRVAEELGRLGERAARAFVNARLYEEVARRQKGLEAQVRLRTGELEGALDELKTAQAKLVEAERSSSLGLLVAGVSHEINNALNFISANVPSLARYVAECEARLDTAGVASTAVTAVRVQLPATLARLGGATRRAVAIVADLRRFARPDTERRLVRPDEGIEAALNLLRRRTDGRFEVVRVCVGAPALEGYPGPLNQCFFNLLLNAVEAARSEIWVVVQERGDRGGVEVTIRDDGDGIPQEVIDQVFLPFFTTKPRHAGLGLAVSKGVVERHGGTLTLWSDPDLGTTVRVRLPARAPEPYPKRMEERGQQ